MYWLDYRVAGGHCDPDSSHAQLLGLNRPTHLECVGLGGKTSRSRELRSDKYLLTVFAGGGRLLLCLLDLVDQKIGVCRFGKAFSLFIIVRNMQVGTYFP
jgi:hypothetical protein